MDLHYEVYGSGDPIVFHHSGGADLRVWSLVEPLLRQKYRTVLFDGRGAGKSPSPVKPTDYVQDLLELFRHLKLERAALVGHSMGGQIATEFALLYPERISKLVLLAPSLSGFDFSADYAERMRKVSEAAPDVDQMVALALDFPSYRAVLSGPRKDLMVSMIRQHVMRTFEWSSFETVWPQPPAIERLGSLAVRTLLAIGDGDLPDLFRIAERFRQVPGVRIAEIEGADHMAMLTHPETVARHIEQFLEE
jgi:pimeloyl-ACP methyl ester carboxylesterase